MAVNPDFRDLFAALNAAQAEHLVIGAYALAVHGVPRFTKDLDLWVRPSPENAGRVWSALQAFGAPLANLTADDFTHPGWMIQIGIAPNRIDLLTSADGLDFEEAWGRREAHTYGGQPVWILSRADLIRNKRATGRPQDLVDIQSLEALG
jgi:hypothetical protein